MPVGFFSFARGPQTPGAGMDAKPRGTAKRRAANKRARRAREGDPLSAFTDFERETALTDCPLDDDTGVGGMDDGFMQDETIAFGIADRPIEKDS